VSDEVVRTGGDGGRRPPEKLKLGADMIWKPSPKAIQAAAEAYISDKGIKAVLEAAINVDRPIVDLSAMRTQRLPRHDWAP
jgi:hypothetical protein